MGQVRDPKEKARSVSLAHWHLVLVMEVNRHQVSSSVLITMTQRRKVFHMGLCHGNPPCRVDHHKFIVIVWPMVLMGTEGVVSLVIGLIKLLGLPFAVMYTVIADAPGKLEKLVQAAYTTLSQADVDASDQFTSLYESFGGHVAAYTTFGEQQIGLALWVKGVSAAVFVDNVTSEDYDSLVPAMMK